MKAIASFIRFLKKNWITAWLIAAAAIIAVMGASAAYTSIYHAKRVVSTSDNDDMLFSSNYLLYPEIFKPIQNDFAYIHICNYAKGNSRRRYNEDLPYRVSAVLTTQGGRTLKDSDLLEMGISADKIEEIINGYSFKIDEISNPEISLDTNEIFHFSKNDRGEYVIPDIISGFRAGEEEIDRFQLKFPTDGSTYPISVMVSATPLINRDDLKPLKAIFGKKSEADSYAVVLWSGEFVDELADDPKLFDAFNYRISGNGVGEAVLMWDPERVEIGKWSLEKLPESTITTDAATGMQKIVFEVGEDDISLYDIQFYRLRNADETEAYGRYEYTSGGINISQNTVYALENGVKKPYILFSFEARNEDE